MIAPNDSHGRMLVKNGLSGFLFSDKRLDLAAKNVERLISTRGLPEKMGFKGRLHVETHFTSERAFEVMIEVIAPISVSMLTLLNKVSDSI